MNNEEKKEYKHEILVETIYTRPKMDADKGWSVAIETHLVSFKGDNYDHVRQDAEKEMDRTIRYGMTLRGGSILKSQILPSAIYQVGLVDLKKYMAEQEAMTEAKAAAAAATAELPVEVSEITTTETLN